MKDKTNTFDLNPFFTQSIDCYLQDNWVHLYARPMLAISLELFSLSQNDDMPSVMIIISALIKTFPKEPKIKLEECHITPDTIAEQRMEYAAKSTELAIKYEQIDGSIGRFQIKFAQPYEARLVNERLKALFCIGKRPTMQSLTPQSQIVSQIGPTWSGHDSQERSFSTGEGNNAMLDLTESLKLMTNYSSLAKRANSYPTSNCLSFMQSKVHEIQKMSKSCTLPPELPLLNPPICSFCFNFEHSKRNCVQFDNFSYFNHQQFESIVPCTCEPHVAQSNSGSVNVTELYAEWIEYAKLFKQAQALDCNHKLLLKAFLK